MDNKLLAVLAGSTFLGVTSVVLISIFGPSDINAKTQLIATITGILIPTTTVLLDLIKTSALHSKLDEQTAQLDAKFDDLATLHKELKVAMGDPNDKPAQ